MIAERQLTEARGALLGLRIRLPSENGHVGRLAVAEDREQEMVDQMDGLLRRADKIRHFMSRGIPFSRIL